MCSTNNLRSCGSTRLRGEGIGHVPFLGTPYWYPVSVWDILGQPLAGWSPHMSLVTRNAPCDSYDCTRLYRNKVELNANFT